MSRLFNTFEFVGNVNIPKNADRFYKVTPFDSGWEKHALNFSVQESKTNGVFVSLEGGLSKKKVNIVKTFGKGTENNKGAKLEIPWDDRLNPETIDMVADFKRFVVDFTVDEETKKKAGQLRYEVRNLEYKDELTDEEQTKLQELKAELKEVSNNRHEFITEYDMVTFLAENLENYKNHKFRITGSITYSEWKGKFYRNFKPEFMEIVSSDEPSKLRGTFDIFFTKDSLDDKDFKEEKKMYIDGYVLSYDSQAKKDQFYPQQFVINAQKIDFNNEKHVKRLELLKNQFQVKGKEVYHLQWEANIFRGADKVEFTFEDLTQKQKEFVELGLNKLEDFAPKGGMLGETTEENRLIKPLLQKVNDANDFREGAVESSYELDDLAYVPAARVPKETVELEDKAEDLKKEVKNDDLDELFS